MEVERLPDERELDAIRREKEEHELREWKERHDEEIRRREGRAQITRSRHRPLGLLLLGVGIVVIILGFIPQAPSHGTVRSSISGQEMIVDCQTPDWGDHDACDPKSNALAGLLVGGALAGYGVYRLTRAAA